MFIQLWLLSFVTLTFRTTIHCTVSTIRHVLHSSNLSVSEWLWVVLYEVHTSGGLVVGMCLQWQNNPVPVCFSSSANYSHSQLLTLTHTAVPLVANPSYPTHRWSTYLRTSIPSLVLTCLYHGTRFYEWGIPLGFENQTFCVGGCVCVLAAHTLMECYHMNQALLLCIHQEPYFLCLSLISYDGHIYTYIATFIVRYKYRAFWSIVASCMHTESCNLKHQRWLKDLSIHLHIMVFYEGLFCESIVVFIFSHGCSAKGYGSHWLCYWKYYTHVYKYSSKIKCFFLMV